jgi:hypothetical protein
MGESGYHLSSKTMPKLAYIWAILSGIDNSDEPVEISVAAVEEVDISYSFLAGLMRQQRLQSTVG